MTLKKTAIVPVTLHNEKENTPSVTNKAKLSSKPSCTIRTATVKISFFNGVNEHIIRTVMRELKNL